MTKIPDKKTFGDAPPVKPATSFEFSAVDKGISVSQQIATQLVNAIRIGDLKIGDRLPSEAALASKFHVSRASVREALSSLQFSGYVDTLRGSGTVVVSTTAIGKEPVSGGGIEKPGDLIDIFEARLLVEPEVMRQGALNPLPAALRAAERMIQGMEVSVANYGNDHHSDLGLHRALLRSCRNLVLVDMAERLLTNTDGRLWRRVRDRAWADDHLPKLWLAQHIAMADAVMGRDGGAAEVASREHLQSVLGKATESLRLSTRDDQRLARLIGDASLSNRKVSPDGRPI